VPHHERAVAEWAHLIQVESYSSLFLNSYVSLYNSTEKFYPQSCVKRKILPDTISIRFLCATFLYCEHTSLLPETVIIERNTHEHTGERGHRNCMAIIKLLLVDDHGPLRKALREGLQATGAVHVLGEAATGQEALSQALELDSDVILMDVQLQPSQPGRKAMSGVAAAIAIRRERPRMPVVFYSIQDDDEYYREFRAAGILTHYAYVRKSNYLLPSMLLPLLRDAINGRSLVDPEIEDRVQEVRALDEQSPRTLLEPNELRVAELVAQGMTNEQIAARLNLHDKRAVSRTNGRIYASWGLSETAVDDKVARARATLIYSLNRMIMWDEDGVALVQNRRGEWVPYYKEG
jgi:DNA-binding NarL/FixJ family response regulator